MDPGFINISQEIRAASLTNYPLSDTLHLEARKLLFEDQRRFDALELRSSSCLDRSDDFDVQRLELIERLKINGLVLAPHRKLPDDTLGDIFSHFSFDPIHIPFVMPETPWNLTSVCSRWRRIALDTPRLWCDVQVDCETDWPRYMQIAAVVWEIFARSKGQPITLKVKAKSGICMWNWTGNSHPVSDFVIPYIQRLRSLSLAVPAAWLSPFLGLPAGVMESLEEIELLAVGDPAPGIIAAIFRNVPLLRKVSVKGAFNQHAFRLPWAQLTDLHLPNALLHPDTAISILKRCTNIVSCILSIEHDDSEPPVSTPLSSPAELTKLEELEVNIDLCKSPVQFFQLLELPTLRRLCVPKELFSKPWDPALAPVFAQFFALQHLDLSMSIETVDIETLLRAAPRLTNLFLTQGRSLSNTTLESMARGDIVPELRHLACWVFDITTFFDLLDWGRWSSEAQLDTVKIWAPEGTDDDDRRYLKFQAEGRRVTWHQF
ncbi:hypothetical protein BDZ94DRAFT_779964 [Collybia nuda]|uniref:F-box domain-containing protein n=1 Tax=Collybia nuda TaxID=64659 RepID=A0A9P5YFI4_9AGAR|nr:hypothetical protein BDZ94DRAFT_779964 [Collybia nuda]